jgi:hypothetical protein
MGVGVAKVTQDFRPASPCSLHHRY